MSFPFRIEQEVRKRMLPFRFPVFERPRGAMGPNFFLCQVLYRLVRKRRPSLIVEFGSGWSTYAIAKAVEANGVGFLNSIDADEHWAQVTFDMVRSLSSSCEVSYSPTEPITCDGRLLLRHKEAPPEADLIFVDGPSLSGTGAIGAYDPVTMNAKLTVFDGRLRNAKFIADTLGSSVEEIRGAVDRNAVVYCVRSSAPQQLSGGESEPAT